MSSKLSALLFVSGCMMKSMCSFASVGSLRSAVRSKNAFSCSIFCSAGTELLVPSEIFVSPPASSSRPCTSPPPPMMMIWPRHSLSWGMRVGLTNGLSEPSSM